MANTGWIAGNASSGNAFFCSSAVYAVLQSAVAFVVSTGRDTCSVTGFSGTISGTVTGVEVQLYGHYNTNGVNHVGVQISNNGGSSFSSAINTADFGGSATDYVLGGSTNDWGLSWGGFSDLSNLQLKSVAAGGVVAVGTHAEMKVYYTPSGYGNDVMGIDSSDISIVNGIATANISKVNGV